MVLSHFRLFLPTPVFSSFYPSLREEERVGDERERDTERGGMEGGRERESWILELSLSSLDCLL